MTDFPTLLYTSTCEIPTLFYTWSLKKVPLLGGAWSTPPPGLRTLRFVCVIQYIFLYKWDELRVTRVVQLFLHLRLNYYEAKIQMLSAFSWKPAKPRFLKIKIKLKFVLSESL